MTLQCQISVLGKYGHDIGLKTNLMTSMAQDVNSHMFIQIPLDSLQVVNMRLGYIQLMH
ncbi:hypothetical protein J579_3221 [Acinetobacter sp. 1239920]|nr:hypothetical protein J579_3221 [Acinetobacter sp. 1239920]